MSRENKFLEREQSITRETIAEFKQHDRRTEIARLTRRKDFVLVIWLGVTWLVFMYVWVWLYPEYDFTTALMASILPATLGGFHYFNERRIVKQKIQPLMKYELLFEEFFEAMIRDMERNDAEKGDSWLTIYEPELRKLQNRKINQLQSKKRTVADDFDYQKELSNYCAMIWIRGRQLN